jgi:hypothetical protein
MRKKSAEKNFYVITKYVRAADIGEALKLDKTTKVHEITLREPTSLDSAIGFDVAIKEEEE